MTFSADLKWFVLCVVLSLITEAKRPLESAFFFAIWWVFSWWECIRVRMFMQLPNYGIRIVLNSIRDDDEWWKAWIKYMIACNAQCHFLWTFRSVCVTNWNGPIERRAFTDTLKCTTTTTTDFDCIFMAQEQKQNDDCSCALLIMGQDRKHRIKLCSECNCHHRNRSHETWFRHLLLVSYWTNSIGVNQQHHKIL